MDETKKDVTSDKELSVLTDYLKGKESKVLTATGVMILEDVHD